MLLFGLRNRRVVGKVVGKLSEITLVTSLLASSKIAVIRSVRTNLVPRVFSLFNMAAAREKTLAHSKIT